MDFLLLWASLKLTPLCMSMICSGVISRWNSQSRSLNYLLLITLLSLKYFSMSFLMRTRMSAFYFTVVHLEVVQNHLVCGEAHFYEKKHKDF